MVGLLSSDSLTGLEHLSGLSNEDAKIYVTSCIIDFINNTTKLIRHSCAIVSNLLAISNNPTYTAASGRLDHSRTLKENRQIYLSILGLTHKTGDRSLSFAEIKKASPSLGRFTKENINLIDFAKAYEDNNISCISVLTDDKYFNGK